MMPYLLRASLSLEVYPKVDRKTMLRGTAKRKGLSILVFNKCKLGKPEFKFIVGAASSLFVTSGITLAFPFVLGKVLDLALVQETADAVGGSALLVGWNARAIFVKALQW